MSVDWTCLVAFHVDQLPVEQDHQLTAWPCTLHGRFRFGGTAMICAGSFVGEPPNNRKHGHGGATSIRISLDFHGVILDNYDEYDLYQAPSLPTDANCVSLFLSLSLSLCFMSWILKRHDSRPRSLFTKWLLEFFQSAHVRFFLSFNWGHLKHIQQQLWQWNSYRCIDPQPWSPHCMTYQTRIWEDMRIPQGLHPPIHSLPMHYMPIHLDPVLQDKRNPSVSLNYGGLPPHHSMPGVQSRATGLCQNGQRQLPEKHLPGQVGQRKRKRPIIYTNHIKSQKLNLKHWASDGWWIVAMTVQPCSPICFTSRIRESDILESNPLVGSSNRRRVGFLKAAGNTKDHRFIPTNRTIMIYHDTMIHYDYCHHPTSTYISHPQGCCFPGNLWKLQKKLPSHDSPTRTTPRWYASSLPQRCPGPGQGNPPRCCNISWGSTFRWHLKKTTRKPTNTSIFKPCWYSNHCIPSQFWCCSQSPTQRHAFHDNGTLLFVQFWQNECSCKHQVLSGCQRFLRFHGPRQRSACDFWKGLGRSKTNWR